MGRQRFSRNAGRRRPRGSAQVGGHYDPQTPAHRAPVHGAARRARCAVRVE
jgi:hypothetical protein